MSFTDEELQELEEDLAHKKRWSTPPINVLGIRALVLRLRAAENYIKTVAGGENLGAFDEEAFRAWRKASGK